MLNILCGKIQNVEISLKILLTKSSLHNYNYTMDNFFQDNLKELASKTSQNELAKKTGFSSASISGYISGKSEPSLKFLLALKEHFGIDIDRFITEKLSSTNVASSSTVDDKFVGNYIVYYYDSSVYKGKASNLSKNTLRYGVISVFKQNSDTKVLASLMKDKENAIILKEKLEDCRNIEEILDVYSKEDTYTGSIESTSTQVFIYIKNTGNNDQGLIILNNPPSNKTYIGGLGTVNSVSRGREHMPCVQFMIVSRHILQIPDGEIYNLLALGMAEINVKSETEQLYKLFQNLSENADSLTEYQRLKIFEDSLSNTLLDLIDANMFRFAKVSGMEDDNYYRIIRDEE